ncbi:MAG: amidohydrolase [Alkalispirochaeta sp.]
MSIFIENAAYVLTRSGVLTNQDIRIDGERITTIRPHGEGTVAGEMPGEAAAPRVINGRRRAVVAGWKNAHTHAAMTLLRGYGDDMRLQPWLQERIWPAEAALTGEQVYWGTRLAALEMIKSGTTFANDMYFFPEEVRRAFEDSGMRAAVGLALFDFGNPEMRRTVQEQVTGVLHGSWDSPGGRVFPVIAPHSIYTCSGELLQWAADRAAERGLVFHIHMNETEQEVADCMEAHGSRPFAWLDELGVVDIVGARAVAAHGIWLDGAEREIAARHGMTIAHNPASNMKLASGVLDWQALRSAGIPLMLAPDGVASNNNLDMFDEMKLAALLQKVHTGDPTRLNADEAVALAAGEYSRAFAEFSIAGHLAEGAPADISIIDLDHPQMVPVHHVESNIAYAANGSVVDTVIIAGEVVMEGRVIPGEAEVLEEARRCAADLAQSVAGASASTNGSK